MYKTAVYTLVNIKNSKYQKSDITPK